jgi:NAD(P)-dependent dehydrogenase (short-subunit alcohol dehydrogenase family)
MEQIDGRVAVVTGAAGGIGLGMAQAFAEAGMKVVLADVDAARLEQAATTLGAAEVLAVPTDVSDPAAVDDLAARAVAAFGGVHVVCNNAGVSPLGAVWENSLADWQWILGVNLWGVVHGVRAFAPHLIAQDEGHIVNTASVSGLISPPGSGAYNVTKHAVVALSESLHHDLRERNSRVGVSVLCPAYVPTGIVDSERSRPKELGASTKSEQTLAREAMLRKAVKSGKVSADQVAQAVVAAIKQERFYILTHPKIKGAIQARMEDILNARAPRNPLAL